MGMGVHTSQAFCLSVDEFCEALTMDSLIRLSAKPAFSYSFELTEDVEAGCEMLTYDEFDEVDVTNFGQLLEMIVDSAGDLSQNWLSDVDHCGFKFFQWVTERLMGVPCEQIRSFERHVRGFTVGTNILEFEYRDVFIHTLTDKGKGIAAFLGKTELQPTIWSDVSN